MTYYAIKETCAMPGNTPDKVYIIGKGNVIISGGNYPQNISEFGYKRIQDAKRNSLYAWHGISRVIKYEIIELEA